MAQLVGLVAVMLILLFTIEDLTPVIKNAKAKARALEDKVTKTQEAIDNFNKTVEGTGKIFQFGAPSLPGQEWAK